MDRITHIGFRHIFERILRCLTTKDLLSIRNLNISFRNILNDPRFWINRLEVVGHKKLKIKWVEVMENLKEPIHNLTKQNSRLMDCITNCLIKLHKEISILKDADRYFENVTVVHIAARYDNVELLKFFRKFNSDEEFYSYDDLGNQPFHEAAMRGNIRSLKYLTETQAILWDRVVLIAAAKGHINMLKFVTEFHRDIRDFDINTFTTSDGNETTPIYLAAQNCHLSALKYLVPLSKNPFKGDSFGHTPLHVAAIHGHIKIVKYLLASNHIPNPWSSDGTTPIIFAAQFNHLNVLKALIPYSKNFLEDFNIRGWNALHMSAIKGHLDIIKYIFKKCNNLTNIPNPISGATPIAYAASRGHIKVVKYLAKRFSKPIILPNFVGANAIHVAARNGHSDVVEFLFKCTDTPNDSVIGLPKSTPLNLAKWHKRLSVVEVIERLNGTTKPSRKRKRSQTKSQ